MASPADVIRVLRAADPAGTTWLPSLLRCLPEIHWGALREPGVVRAAPLARDVVIADGPVHLACCLETDTLVLVLEDARESDLPSGTAADPKRHHVSRAIEAARALADHRHFGMAIVAAPGYAEPHRATILEGLPHLEREDAEDLYANYWGVIPEERLDALTV